MSERDKPTTAPVANGNGATFDIAAAIAAEDADFVSLNQLLTAIAAAYRSSYQDAARLLLRRLKNTDDDDRPWWCRLDVDHGIVDMSRRTAGDSGAWDCLKQAAEHGEPLESPDDEIPF